MLGRSALPYGYTVTIWTTGAVLNDERGKPAVGQVWLFLAGAIGAFALLGLATTLRRRPPLEISEGVLLRTGMVHFSAVSAALGVACLLGLIPSGVAWPLGAFGATATYLLGAGVEVLLARRRGEASNPD